MRSQRIVCPVLFGLVIATAAASVALAQVPQAPVSAVPQIYTIKGEYTRIAYNNEGWVTLGYRTANGSQGKDWMVLNAGITLQNGVPNQTMTRAQFRVKMPDGSFLPMASQEEFQNAGYLRGLVNRDKTVRDSINYFPNPGAQGAPMLFFTDPADQTGALAFDKFEASWQRGYVGRLFFKFPEGQKIEPGQYWLSVKFANSTVEAPFRIMTKDEEKYLRKNWKDLKKEHEAYLKSQAEKAKQK